MQKLPSHAVPKDLELTGAITLRFHPSVCVAGSYEVQPKDDGRVKLQCWKEFINQVGWKVGTKIVLLLCQCADYACLFVNPLDADLME
jgi:hypothetical protein